MSGTGRPRVAITQPYVPLYRAPLWEHVLTLLEEEGIEAQVFFGGSSRQRADRARRADAATPPWAIEVPTFNVQVAGRPLLVFRRLPRVWRNPTVLVTELAASNVNAYGAAIRGSTFVTLGHGWSIAGHESRTASAAENWVNRRARHVLTYTPRGRRTVLDRTGLPADRVTSFDNATDISALVAGRAALTSTDARRARSELGIPGHAAVALALGTLTRAKRIDVLVDAARRVLVIDPDAYLIVAGEGPETNLLAPLLAAEPQRVRHLGHIRRDALARVACVADFIVNPGRVGLVAVDSKALGLPIVTSHGSSHAPEIDYLTPGSEVFFTEAGAESFARGWLDLAGRRAAGEATRYQPDLSSLPSVESAGSTIARVIADSARRSPGQHRRQLR